MLGTERSARVIKWGGLRRVEAAMVAIGEERTGEEEKEWGRVADHVLPRVSQCMTRTQPQGIR